MSVLLNHSTCSPWSSPDCTTPKPKIKVLLITQLRPVAFLLPDIELNKTTTNKRLFPFHNEWYTNQALQPQPNIVQHLVIGRRSFLSSTETNVESLTEVVYFDVWPDCVVRRSLTGVIICLGD